MKVFGRAIEMKFEDAVKGLIAGDFSLHEPLFLDQTADGRSCRIIEWYEAGLFSGEPKALNEALSCACFNGCTKVAEYLLARGVSPEAGDNTGLNAFHWAANRGQLEVVKLLIDRKAPLETRNMHGTTVLGTAVWSATNEPRKDHIRIIEELIKGGALTDDAGYPSGNKQVDEVFRRLGAAS